MQVLCIASSWAWRRLGEGRRRQGGIAVLCSRRDVTQLLTWGKRFPVLRSGREEGGVSAYACGGASSSSLTSFLRVWPPAALATRDFFYSSFAPPDAASRRSTTLFRITQLVEFVELTVTLPLLGWNVRRLFANRNFFYPASTNVVEVPTHAWKN